MVEVCGPGHFLLYPYELNEPYPYRVLTLTRTLYLHSRLCRWFTCLYRTPSFCTRGGVLGQDLACRGEPRDRRL
jgi:hypothetical protein